MLYICTKLVKTDYIIKVVKIVGSELNENRMDGSSDSVEIKKRLILVVETPIRVSG